MLVDFNLTLLNLTQNYLPETHLQIQAATRIEVAICFFYGAPCTQHFYTVKCSKSILLGRICGEQSLSLSLSFIVLNFKNFFLTMLEYQRHIQDLVKHPRWSLC